MRGKKALFRFVWCLVLALAAVSGVSCVVSDGSYYGDPYYYGSPPPPPGYYYGPGYGGGHGEQAAERHRNRMRQNCNTQWANCTAMCNQVGNPSQRAMCIANCNNALNNCMSGI